MDLAKTKVMFRKGNDIQLDSKVIEEDERYIYLGPKKKSYQEEKIKQWK